MHDLNDRMTSSRHGEILDRQWSRPPSVLQRGPDPMSHEAVICSGADLLVQSSDQKLENTAV